MARFTLEMIIMVLEEHLVHQIPHEVQSDSMYLTNLIELGTAQYTRDQECNEVKRRTLYLK